MKDIIDVLPAPSPVRMPGRPQKPNAKTTAQRAKAYRQRQKADGLKAVKCYLPPEGIAYLNALRQIHGVTISDAILMVMMSVIRGESLPRR